MPMMMSVNIFYMFEAGNPRTSIHADGDNAGLFDSQVCFMQLQIAPRREFQCELRLIMRLASRTFRDFHTCELERRMLVMKMLIKPFVESLRMSLPTFETHVSPTAAIISSALPVNLYLKLLKIYIIIFDNLYNYAVICDY